MEIKRVTTTAEGTITGLPANKPFAIVELPPKAQIETQPPAGLAAGKVRSVVTITAIEDDPNAQAQEPQEAAPVQVQA